MTHLPKKKLIWIFLLLFIAGNLILLILYQSGSGWPLLRTLQSLPLLNRVFPKTSTYNDVLNQYFDKQKQGGKSLFQYSNQQPSATAAPDVQGVTSEGEVLQAASTPSYLQYLPLPGAANFSSDLFNGSSTVNYPIKLPPGFGGYTPGVSLSYSSAAVDEFLHGINTKLLHVFTRQSGSLGLGWSIDESAITIDTHGKENPCFWTWKIAFPGGSGELFKTDANGITVTKCEEVTDEYAITDWQFTSAWNSGQWRTDPEMFLKITTENPWTVKTPDGTTYVFGGTAGSVINESHPWVQSGGAFGGCDYTPLTWKLSQSTNVHGQQINYAYTPVEYIFDAYTHPDPPYTVYTCTVTLRSRTAEINYGVNRVVFNYAQARNDTKVVSETGEFKRGGDGLEHYFHGYYDNNDQMYVDTLAMSTIDIYANSQLARKYKMAYYDVWTPIGSPADFGAAGCSWYIRYETGDGYYVLNDSIPSSHLTLKSITEEVSVGNEFPPTTFTYQAIPYTINAECLGNVAAPNLYNSIYLKKANNGFGGTTEYTYDPTNDGLDNPIRLSDQIFESNGTNYFDNSDPSIAKMNKGLKRARLNKIKVNDAIAEVSAGAGNFVETALDYQGAEPTTVLTPDVLNRAGGTVNDDDFAGYSSVVNYKGKQNLTINIADPITWSSKAKTFYHQSLASSGCYRKDPRSGSPWRAQFFDNLGLLTESTSYQRFKNVADMANAWPNSNGESCTAIPDRPLVLDLRADQVTAKEGVVASALIDSCATATPASYCNFLTSAKNTYDWDFALTNNPESGKFGALLKSESFTNTLAGAVLTANRTSLSDTNYISQGYGIGNTSTYLLNKVTQSWLNHPTDAADTKKYKWQKIYYDNQAFGVLSPTGKGLLTKAETLLSNGTQVGKSEIVTYDAWGNVTQTRDGNGNPATSVFDDTFHAYQTSSTNALTQTSISTYNTILGVPVTVTDINNKTYTFEYDGLGRLTKVFKPGDTQPTTPTTEFAYFYNQPATYGIPLAVLTKIRTEQNTLDTNKILQSYDLYNGLGSRIQTQLLVDGKVRTTWADQDTTSKTIIGLQNFTFDELVSPDPFGKLRRAWIPGTRVSYSKSNLTGNFSKLTDFNGNTSYTSSNVEQATSKTVGADGSMSVAVINPITRVTTATVCKELRQVDETTFLNERYTYTCPGSAGQITTKSTANFLGNVVNTKDTTDRTISSTSYDEVGRVLNTENEDSGISYIVTYDLNGNILKTSDAAGTTYETTYDSLNRPLLSKVNTVIKMQNFYDQNYDSQDCGTSPIGKNCKRQTVDNFGNTINAYIKHDDVNRVIQERANFGGGLASYFGSSDFITNYTYDNLDRIKTIGYPQFPNTGIPAETVTYTYSGPYLKTVAGDQTYVSNINYDDFSRITTRTLGNNLTETYGYNTQHRLGTISVTGAASNHLALGYNYENTTGNVTSITDTVVDPFTNRSATFGYDSLSRLTTVNDTSVTPPNTHTYQYDDLGNLSQKTEGGKTYTFTTNTTRPYHGVKQINNTPVEYDILGRMLTYQIPNEYKIIVPAFDTTTGKPQQITYQNLLVVPSPSPAPSASPAAGTGGNVAQATSNQEVLGVNDPITETYHYDSNGRRIMKKTSTPNSETLYVNQYLERDNQHGLIRKNYFADGKLVAVRAFEVAPPPLPSPVPSPVTTPTPANGDANNDGLVNEADYAIFQPNYNQANAGGKAAGDFNLDGRVDYLDYAIWYTTYTPSLPTCPSGQTLIVKPACYANNPDTARHYNLLDVTGTLISAKLQARSLKGSLGGARVGYLNDWVTCPTGYAGMSNETGVTGFSNAFFEYVDFYTEVAPTIGKIMSIQAWLGMDSADRASQFSGDNNLYLCSSGPVVTPAPTAPPGASPQPTATPAATPPASDVIFSDGFESGNTSAWSSETDTQNDLNVTTGAKLVGTKGLAALIDDNTNMFVTDTRPVAEPRYRARFYFDPNDIPMVNGDVHTIFRGRKSGGNSSFDVELNENSGAYRIRTKIWNDANSSTLGTYYTITDAPHYIEIEWKAATAVGANNGTIALWIDGVLKYTSPGIDNDTHRVEDVRLGPLSGIDTGTRGTTYFDAFESRRSTYIGP